jgi:hypothetical protein
VLEENPLPLMEMTPPWLTVDGAKVTEALATAAFATEGCVSAGTRISTGSGVQATNTTRSRFHKKLRRTLQDIREPLGSSRLSDSRGGEV